MTSGWEPPMSSCLLGMMCWFFRFGSLDLFDIKDRREMGPLGDWACIPGFFVEDVENSRKYKWRQAKVTGSTVSKRATKFSHEIRILNLFSKLVFKTLLVHSVGRRS